MTAPLALLGALLAVLLSAPAPGGMVTFRDVSAEAGVDVNGLGNSSAWADVDLDGDLDLLATDSDIPNGQVYLYGNDGDETFTDMSAGSGLNVADIRSAAWGDYDNDGDPDLAATTYSSGSRARLFRNDGAGHFVDVGEEAGFVGASIPWRVSWADYNLDGWLDLFQANLGRDLLYVSNGEGTFDEVATEAGVAHAAWSSMGAWGDYDNDGWPDLFVPNDGPDHLYSNNRDGTFTDVTLEAGVNDTFDSSSACWGDFDDDFKLDLYVVNIGSFGEQTRNILYRNEGDGTFIDVTARARVGDVGDGRTCNWLDYDNDGRLDLFATNHVNPNRLFRNLGNGRFAEVADEAGIAHPADVFNGAWGDLDSDGDLDVMVVGHFGNVLFANEGPVGGYVHLELVGSGSNRSAIGARAWISLPGRRPNRTVDGATGAYGHDSLSVEFGVGTAPGPFTIRIRWPSGTIQTLTGVPANSSMVVTEP